MRRAKADDVPVLIDLMEEFYAEGGYKLDRERAGEAFSTILSDERLGYVWIIQDQQEEVGHLVLTLKYAMEYGGLIACLDDFYVKRVWRNRGLGRAALFAVRNFCEEAGIRAITVEVGHDNGAAQAAYRRIGFAEAAGRQLLALALRPPTHVE